MVRLTVTGLHRMGHTGNALAMIMGLHTSRIKSTVVEYPGARASMLRAYAGPKHLATGDESSLIRLQSPIMTCVVEINAGLHVI